ncbi:MAG: MaoC/PaaZ C-terminal domain-containing protein [Bradyrhizobium sp.]|nr:MaoC/PaaZ C-terminal domain-containing protein [Bradyrhizobium sp.]
MHASQPLWLGDIRPGMRLPLPGFDCSAELVAGYAELLDAKHPIHTDPEFARGTRYGRLIAHGPLVIAKVLAMLGGVFGPALQVMLDVGEWRFYGPVFVGDAVKVECFVIDLSPAKGNSAGAVRLEIRVLGGDGALAQRGTASLLVSRAPAAPSA